MLNLTESQQEFITRFTTDISTQEVIEDLMLMYSAYVDDVTDTEKFQIGRETILDIQSKLFIVQNVLELVSLVSTASSTLRKVS